MEKVIVGLAGACIVAIVGTVVAVGVTMVRGTRTATKVMNEMFNAVSEAENEYVYPNYKVTNEY